MAKMMMNSFIRTVLGDSGLGFLGVSPPLYGTTCSKLGSHWSRTSFEEGDETDLCIDEELFVLLSETLNG